MAVFSRHVFVCTQQKPAGATCCGARGGEQVLAAFREEVMRRGLTGQVGVTAAGSMGLCDVGPNVVVYPDGVWYTGVQVTDVPRIVEEHLVGGRAVADKAWDNERVAAKMAENRAKAMAARAAAAAADQGK
jgi:(2Fe-2S) ferredoxin